MTEEQRTLQARFRRLAFEKLHSRSLLVDAQPPGPIDDVYRNIMIAEKMNTFLIPEQYGGRALDRVTLSIIMEELGYGCAGFAGIYAQTLHAVSTLLIGGSDAQKALFFPLLLNPEGIAAGFCATEEKSGSDASSFLTTAQSEGDYYILNGAKSPIINAGDARFYIVWANTNSEKGRAGISAFVIPRETSGITFSPYHDKPGLRPVPTATVFLQNVKIPASHLIALPGSGYLLLMQTVDWGRAFVGAIGVGLTRAAIEAAIQYAKTRVILNRPIINNQGVSFILADLSTKLEAARYLVWRACRLIDLDGDYTIASSMAKLFSSELAVRATSEGMLIMGQKGYHRPSLMEKYQRDAQALRIVEGTTQIQKMIISSQL